MVDFKRFVGLITSECYIYIFYIYIYIYSDWVIYILRKVGTRVFMLEQSFSQLNDYNGKNYNTISPLARGGQPYTFWWQIGITIFS